MVSVIDIDVVAAWLMMHIWAGRSERQLTLETASVELPFKIQDEAFETAQQRLIKIGLIDADCQITIRGTNARDLPGHALTYEMRFKMLFDELAQAKLTHEIHDIKRRVGHNFTSFSQLVVMEARMEEAFRAKQD